MTAEKKLACRHGTRPDQLIGNPNGHCPTEFYTSDAEMKRDAILALQGDGEAAENLSGHLAAIGKYGDADRWLGVALLEGNEHALENTAARMLDSSDLCVKLAGIRLAKRVKNLSPASANIMRMSIASAEERIGDPNRLDCRLMPATEPMH